MNELQDFISKYLIEYPIILLLIILLIIVLFLIIVVIQGRYVKIWLIEIGEDPKKAVARMADEMNKSAKESVENAKQEYKDIPKVQLYQPQKMSESTEYILSTKLDLENKIRRIVLSTGGGWAGSSMAEADTYLEYAINGGHIDKRLEHEIQDFYWIIKPGEFGEEIPDKQLFEIQLLATKIHNQLDDIISIISDVLL